MFEGLAEKLQEAFKKLSRNARLTEADVDTALREVRIALLEADVNFKVVKEFVARIKQRAVGEQILEGLNAGHQVVKFVHEELVRLLSGDPENPGAATALVIAPKPPTVIMLCGLQGAGKTTLAGKLANWFRKQGKTVVMAACDIQRPAAIKQLQVVGEQVKTPVYTVPGADPVRIAREATEWAVANKADVVLLDTAGRLHVDDDLMNELRAVKEATQPQNVLLVLDAMTGQDAVNVATEFNESIGVDGFVLTKVDGDTRGGAAISIRAVVGKPIKFLGVGEKMDAIEVFHPDRLAQRILGMGDVLGLIEKAEAAIDEKKAAEMEKKLAAGKFDFEDFLDQMQQMRRLGPLEQLLKMLPGVGTQLKDVDFAAGEKEMARFEAIVRSMTPKERRHPEIINGSRRKRIASGAGVSVQQVNQTITNFEQMRQLMRGLASGNLPGMPALGGGFRPMQQGIAKRKSKDKKTGGGNSGGNSNRFRTPFGRG
ncbi:MAG: signal recognition particle protein [Capsulimonadales bacterium]|nr:signal recognition particle protein [Capsulimonadales bacterium]